MQEWLLNKKQKVIFTLCFCTAVKLKDFNLYSHLLQAKEICDVMKKKYNIFVIKAYKLSLPIFINVSIQVHTEKK